MDPITLTVLAVIAIVSIGVAMSMAPKVAKPKPAELTDFDAPTADESRSIPVIFGKVRVTGPNLTWYGDLYTIPIKSKGGK